VDNAGKAYEAMFESTSLTDCGMQDDLYAGMTKRYVFQRVGYIGPEYYDEIREEPGKGKCGGDAGRSRSQPYAEQPYPDDRRFSVTI